MYVSRSIYCSLSKNPPQVFHYSQLEDFSKGQPGIVIIIYKERMVPIRKDNQSSESRIGLAKGTGKNPNTL